MSLDKKETKHVFIILKNWLKSYKLWLIENNYIHYVATINTSEYNVLSYYCDFLIKSQNQSFNVFILYENYFQKQFKIHKTCEFKC